MTLILNADFTFPRDNEKYQQFVDLPNKTELLQSLLDGFEQIPDDVTGRFSLSIRIDENQRETYVALLGDLFDQENASNFRFLVEVD